MKKLLFTLLISISTGLSFAQLQQVHEATNLGSYLNRRQWDLYFPNRYGMGAAQSSGKAIQDFFSYEAFTEAARHFPAFLNEGNDTQRRQELAAFLANIAQETSGGWADAPGGYFKWGLYFREEQGCEHGCPVYADTSNKQWPPVTGVSYHGRGPKQLSWNYNYGQFSEAWYGNKDSLLLHPERLTEDAMLSFASAIWFWMTAQPPKPSCHDIMTGQWIPTARDTAGGRLPGFGTTVNVINGGLECNTSRPLEKTRYRYAYYHYFCTLLRVPPGGNADCNAQKPFTQ